MTAGTAGFWDCGMRLRASLLFVQNPNFVRPSTTSSPTCAARDAQSFDIDMHIYIKDRNWIAGAIMRVFNPAKTIADCFKFRNKIGIEVDM
jgi:hypothetical protein